MLSDEADEGTVTGEGEGSGSGAVPELALVWTSDGQERRTPLPREGVLRIGRHRACDVVFEHLSVSRLHAEVRGMYGKYRLMHMSRNSPTWHNGSLLIGQVELHPGDVVQLGVVELRVELDQAG